MVQANPEGGDGIRRHIQYATFRKDKPAATGYSAELISNRVDPKFYDNMGEQPVEAGGCDNILQYFKRNVQERPNEPFLGTRPLMEQPDAHGKPQHGEYEWKSFAEVGRLAENFAKGMLHLNLTPEVEGEGKMWRFIGVWAKNRWEWTNTLLACMHFNITTVGFYDAQSAEQVDYIIQQTEMTTVTCTIDYAKKLIDMKKKGMIPKLSNLVVMGDVDTGVLQSAQEQQIDVHTYGSVCSQGETAQTAPFVNPDKHDVYIFSYTSGTTGDPKGVKLSHFNILSAARNSIVRAPMLPGETMISYLPFTHSFEQALFSFTLIQKLRVGFYTGDPAKIVEDCSKLQPNFFPSVPRLYNRIYSKLQAGITSATGCKGWLATRAMNTKQANYAQNGAYTHGCWDSLVFKKMRALLGGNVRIMVTGSAPIEKQVIDYIKICFSCPLVEGYGLTESSAGSCLMDLEDTVTGHVGGPMESIKIRLKDLPEMNYTSADKPYPRGEICMAGPSIFSGYYKRPDKTAEAFDAEGWFLTGDVGMVFPNGSIKIIDRSKNIFKLSQGEYIAPEKIEQIMSMSPFIAQFFQYGDSFKNCCVAVIVPEEEAIKKWARENSKCIRVVC